MFNPKTNWTENDYFNPLEDFNRIENNTQVVANFLIDMMYSVPLEAVITNRTLTFIDFLSSINRIERNIESVKDRFLAPPGWQNTKVWYLGMPFDFREANRLEENLNRLYNTALIAKDNLIYCGTFSCGAEWEGGLY